MEQVTFTTELLLTSRNASTWNRPWLPWVRSWETDGIVFPSMSLHCTWGCGNHPSEVHFSFVSPSFSASMEIRGEEPKPGNRDQGRQFKVSASGYTVSDCTEGEEKGSETWRRKQSLGGTYTPLRNETSWSLYLSPFVCKFLFLCFVFLKSFWDRLKDTIHFKSNFFSSIPETK